jgi:hypothetical protein
MTTVAPDATTVGLAGQVPKEEEKSAVPGAFIETPANEDQTFSVKPIPATAGLGNPITLAPGEKVPDPSTFTGNTVESTVTTDKESYEAGSTAAAVPAPKDDPMFSVPPIQKGLIPESSLPMGGDGPTDGTAGPFISSVGATATTVGLAGQVPLEPKSEVPEVVKESQEEAHFDPEASANPTAVEEKKEVEEELKSKVPEEPATSESGVAPEKVAAAVTGAAAAAGAAVVGAAAVAKGKATDVATSASSAAQGIVSSTEEKALTPAADTAAGVPEVVTDSIKKAHESAEAAANPEAVEEKKEVEAELAKKVAPVEDKGEPAPTAGTTTDGPSDGPSTPQKENVKPSEETPDTGASSAKKSKRKSILLKLKKFLK